MGGCRNYIPITGGLLWARMGLFHEAALHIVRSSRKKVPVRFLSDVCAVLYNVWADYIRNSGCHGQRVSSILNWFNKALFRSRFLTWKLGLNSMLAILIAFLPLFFFYTLAKSIRISKLFIFPSIFPLRSCQLLRCFWQLLSFSRHELHYTLDSDSLVHLHLLLLEDRRQLSHPKSKTRNLYNRAGHFQDWYYWGYRDGFLVWLRCCKCSLHLHGLFRTKRHKRGHSTDGKEAKANSGHDCS